MDRVVDIAKELSNSASKRKKQLEQFKEDKDGEEEQKTPKQDFSR